MNLLFKNRLIIPFIIIALTLYVLFIFFIDNVPEVPLEYVGILLCFGFSFRILGQFTDTWIVRIALFFTAIADYFLLILVGYELIGVMVFSIVQLLYGIRLINMESSKKRQNQFIYFRLFMIFLFQIIGLLLVDGYDSLTLITFFYFSNLVTNVILSFYYFRLNNLFAIGLLLFLFCDIFVGLNNAQSYLNISEHSIWDNLLNLPIDLMWFFYYPSQVLITLSILTYQSKPIPIKSE